MKIPIKIRIGVENLLFPAQKTPASCLEMQFFPFSFKWGYNYQLAISQLGQNVSVFFPPGPFFDQFFRGAGEPQQSL